MSPTLYEPLRMPIRKLRPRLIKRCQRLLQSFHGCCTGGLKPRFIAKIGVTFGMEGAIQFTFKQVDLVLEGACFVFFRAYPGNMHFGGRGPAATTHEV